MAFLWTTIMVKDLDASIEFYTNIVGLSVNRRFKNGPMELAFLGNGETEVELICNEGCKPEYTDYVSMGFTTESVEQKIAELKGQGIEVIDGPYAPNPHIAYFFVLDPNGFKIQFVEQKNK